MTDAALARLINAAVAAQQRGVHPSILGACAAILEASGVVSPGAATPSPADGIGGGEAPRPAAPAVISAAIAASAQGAAGDDIERAIRKWLGRRKPAEVVSDVRLWYANRGLAEPSLQTIQAIIASAQAKRAARVAAAKKAWSNKSPEGRMAWKASLGKAHKTRASSNRRGRAKA